MAKGKSFRHGRGTCIFCTRQPPDVKISKEHVFAEWLRELFPRDASTTHTHGIVSWPTTGSATAPQTITQRIGQGHSGSKKVKVVCHDCNSTWLSNQVETPAKAVMLPLIIGNKAELGSEEQKALATWAAKTVMTAEQINRSPVQPAILQAERTWLKANLAAPEGWHVWAVPYIGGWWSNLSIFQHPVILEIPTVNRDANTRHNLHLTIIGVGHIVFLVMGSSWSRIWDILDKLTPSGWFRVWPPRLADNTRVPAVMTDAEINYFTTYLSRVLNQRIDP